MIKSESESKSTSTTIISKDNIPNTFIYLFAVFFYLMILKYFKPPTIEEVCKGNEDCEMEYLYNMLLINI